MQAPCYYALVRVQYTQETPYRLTDNTEERVQVIPSLAPQGHRTHTRRCVARAYFPLLSLCAM